MVTHFWLSMLEMESTVAFSLTLARRKSLACATKYLRHNQPVAC